MGVYGFDRVRSWPRLLGAGIGYSHPEELAPTTEIRQLQYREDEKRGEGKRARMELAPAYVERYTEKVLDQVDLASVVRWIGNSKPALLCVERDPEAATARSSPRASAASSASRSSTSARRGAVELLYP
ncbi:MAG TPA: DUF488 domain-containing protein [Solirubrobacterales bacterium]|nr:DUF488 domain-containing protein [Solirubrobacterales bacterium]